MTTHTPTSEPAWASGAGPGGPGVPADWEWLDRLAAEALAALRHGYQAPIAGLTPLHPGPGGAPLPAVGLTAAPGGEASAWSPVPGGPPLPAVPEDARTAAVPALDLVPAPTSPPSPGAAPSTAGLSPTFAPAAAESRPSGVQVPAPAGPDLSAGLPEILVPRSYGLPGDADLTQLLSGVGVASWPAALPGATSAATPDRKEPGLFYFVDPYSGGLDERTLGRITGESHPGFDVTAVRRDFPILGERVHGRPLVWFDNAATTQKPNAVIERIAEFYRHENSNIHRAAHELAARATEAYEDARRTVARFLGAATPDEIVFVRGTTEAINLVAKAWGPAKVAAGDEIVVSLLEHHANIVPWQQLAALVGARLRVIPVDSRGQIRLDEYQKLLNDRTKLVAISQVSNALGTITPVQEVIDLAHRVGARVLVDGAQSVAHLAVDVRALDADFFVFSGHKIFAPTGIGVLYGKTEVLEAMEPWQGGGNMIADVTFERTLYQGPPARFEAGTPNIADAVGLAEALRYVERLGLPNIARYEHALLEYGTRALEAVPGLHLIGTAPDKASVLSFVLDGYSPAEVGSELNREGIAVRAGHHCAQPIVRHFGHEATVRPSLAFYNTVEELDLLATVLHRLARGRRPVVKPDTPAQEAPPSRRRHDDWAALASAVAVPDWTSELPGTADIARIPTLTTEALDGLTTG